jgi:uncharacterized protein (TIGR03437 family)
LRTTASVALFGACLAGLLSAQVPRPLAVNQSHYSVTAGGRIAINAPPESVAFMRAAKTRVARAANRTFPVAATPAGDQVLVGVPLTTEPGDYSITLSFTNDSGEERTATAELTVEPFARPAAGSSTPPVVLLDGWQLSSLFSSCPMSSDSTGTFGNLQSYLLGAPNFVPAVYFFENCTECPGCPIEKLGADLGAFLTSLGAPQVDVIAHSMGGLIVRSYLSGKQETSGVFSPPAATGIRKAVFIATPHFGSFQADSPIVATLFGNDAQTTEMQRASQFVWDLATWNQFGDHLRGIDALAVIGDAGSWQSLANASDGVVVLTSASMEFAETGRTRVVNYCHITLSSGGLESQYLGCAGQGIAYIDSPSHQTYQIVSSFLLNTTAWQSVGAAPAENAYLSKYGGMVVADLSAGDQYIKPPSVTWGNVKLTPGASNPQLFYSDMDNGSGTFNFGSSTCGPFTQPIGIYATVRCKAVPAIGSVGPLLSGPAKLVQAGAPITIHGTGFGPQQCASCTVTAGNPQPTTLQVSSWSDTSIQAFLPATFSGISQIAVTTASGLDSINIMGVTSVTPVIAGVTNSATGQEGAIAPGELISIYGSNLGPPTGISFSLDPNTGLVATTLGGAQVLFGSYAAPILYASATQINAVVPYELSGSSQITMQVAYSGGSASQTLQVAAASPGAYTSNFSGSGQVVAANQDSSINSSFNPAAKGSYVTIYFTGGGQTDPVGITGSVNPTMPLKRLVQQPTVTVGGTPATVTFAGSAPGLVDGVDQLNIQLSPDTPSGAQPVVITSGAVQSPASVTLAVQ